jgi:phosphohistidine phosphatase
VNPIIVDIYLLRHGKAEDAGSRAGDAGRALANQGRKDIIAVAQWMKKQGLLFDLIATSPLIRARETAEIVAAALGQAGNVRIWETLLPDGDPDTICQDLGQFNEDAQVLLVSHEPLLSLLISNIISGTSGAAIAMTKGGLAKIRKFSLTAQPSGELHWLLSARQIAAMR